MKKTRYIDANNIKFTGLPFEDINNEVYFSLSDIRKSIEQTPTADVVEVVRCKDCIYHFEDDNGYYDPNNIFCGFACDNGFTENDYCSHGERKEQGK